MKPRSRRWILVAVPLVLLGLALAARSVAYSQFRGRTSGCPGNFEEEETWVRLLTLDEERARRELVACLESHDGADKQHVVAALLRRARPSPETAAAVRTWTDPPEIRKHVVLSPYLELLVLSAPDAELEGFGRNLEDLVASDAAANVSSGGGMRHNYLTVDIDSHLATLNECLPEKAAGVLRRYAVDPRISWATRLPILEGLVERGDPEAERLVRTWLAEEQGASRAALENSLAHWGRTGTRLAKELDLPDSESPRWNANRGPGAICSGRR